MPEVERLAEPPLALVGIDDVALYLHVPRHHVGEARLADARRGERGAREVVEHPRVCEDGVLHDLPARVAEELGGHG